MREERLRVVEAAALICLEDIRAGTFDTFQYPPPDSFLQDIESPIPETVQKFFETIILKHKRSNLGGWKNKSLTLCHALMSAVRPKSFISSIKTSVGAYLYRKFGSKHLVNLCAALGFSCSYSEAMLLESSAIARDEASPNIERGAFIQIVYDNADVNINTLDGENTFHEMGGIVCITPCSALLPDQTIPRLKTYMPADTVSSFGTLPLKPCTVRKNAGLSAVPITDLQGAAQLASDVLPSAPDILWLYGKWSNTPDVPGWNGFMEQQTSEKDFQTTKVMYLPFIRAPPTDYDTILTALVEASKRTAALSQHTCFVTFDQPLYWKARDIVASGQYPELQNVVVRLGGFHLLMSFLGCIGEVMAGSGLKELFTTIYAENSVDKMLHGHAYSRAVRSHILTNLVLAEMVMSEMNLTNDERAELERLINGKESILASENEVFQLVSVKFRTALEKIEHNGPTSKLWCQYYRMTALMKLFIQAERMGDWKLHLECVSKMLPFFHSAGHFFYAKSARLYLQDMLDLEKHMKSNEYLMFTGGNFTIRRSDKFWSGLWTDLTIEQVLMRSMKSQGGLTHGRGISSSVLARWSIGMVSMLNICEEVERFTGTATLTSEQHVDMRAARIVRDTADTEKLKIWFNTHPPFPITDRLVSIYSGIVGGPDINCHLAQELGAEGLKQIVGNTFGKVTFKRKDKVKTLASVTTSVKVFNKRVVIDPLTIFQRVCVTKQSDEQLKQHFAYELAPYPLSLFTEEGMRKGTKSSFYSAFTPLTENIVPGNRAFTVVDGGYLLHKVIWHRNDSVRAIIAGYVSYVFNHFGKNTAVVFDGYPENAAMRSTKSAERLRRSASLSCSDILFDESTPIKVPQAKLLSNESNKRRLITMMRTEFERLGIEIHQSEEDADADIVRTALSKSSDFDQVFIIGEDVDLLVLLNGLNSGETNVYFQKGSRGGSDCIQYPANSFTCGEMQIPRGVVLFLHAISGCDTTSALFWQGKMKWCNILKKTPDWIDLANIFLDPNANKEDVGNAGEKILMNLYGGDVGTLNTLRYSAFVKSAVTVKVNLARLPPTTDAAKYHSWRTYHQLQKWLGVEKNPCDWGWETSEQGLMPVTMCAEPAPQTLLKMMACKCKKGCLASCTCRKAGLKCSILCSFCHGRNCNNAIPIVLDEEDEDEDNPTPYADPPSPPENTIPPPPLPPTDLDWLRPGPSKRAKV